MECEIGGRIYICEGYILNKDVLHRRLSQTEDSQKLVFVFLPGTLLFFQLQIILNNKKCILLSHDIIQKIRNSYERTYGNNEENNPSSIDADKYILDILKDCGIEKGLVLTENEHIRKIIALMKKKETLYQEDVEEILSQCRLSKSRVLHLFKEVTGVSFKRYVQYQKFFKTWEYLAKGENITEASIHAGFSDSAHYANFMKKCFGLNTKKELMQTYQCIWLGGKEEK